MTSGDYARAYLVLGGQGWTLRDFFIGGNLRCCPATAGP